jgi:hypothetical protein
VDSISAALLEPLDIFVIGASPTAGASLAFGNEGGRLDPFVELHMPIGKGDVGGLGVEGGRVIDNPVRFDGTFSVQVAGVAHIDAEEAVIDTVAAFIEDDESAGWIADIIDFHEGFIGFVSPLGEGRFAFAYACGVHPAIHGDGADVDRFIRRALVDFGAWVVVGHGGLSRIGQQSGIGLVFGFTHGACDPVGKDTFAVLSVGIAGEVALVVLRIKHPGHHELPCIALAGGAPGFLFDPPDGRQQHGGEDRDDRHHDQELQERKATRGGSGHPPAKFRA